MPAARTTNVALAGLVLGALTWMASADEVARQPAPPTNLQVLPAHLSHAGVRSLMRQYERALGVSCGYCHVEDRDSGFIDYASDENPRKHTARLMITMLNEINDRHLAQLGGDRRYAQAVTCGSCHQGRATPQAFEP